MLEKLKKQTWVEGFVKKLRFLGEIADNFRYPKGHSKREGTFLGWGMRSRFWIALMLGVTFLILTVLFPPLAIFAAIGPSVLAVGSFSAVFGALFLTLLYMVIGASPLLMVYGFRMKNGTGGDDPARTFRLRVAFVVAIGFLILAALFPPVAFLGFSAVFHITVYGGLAFFVGKWMGALLYILGNDNSGPGKYLLIPLLPLWLVGSAVIKICTFICDLVRWIGGGLGAPKASSDKREAQARCKVRRIMQRRPKPDSSALNLAEVHFSDAARTVGGVINDAAQWVWVHVSGMGGGIKQYLGLDKKVVDEKVVDETEMVNVANLFKPTSALHSASVVLTQNNPSVDRETQSVSITL